MPAIIFVRETASTNTALKKLSAEQELEEGTTLAAFSQVAGRGQTGTSWEAEPGKNLSFSTILYPTGISFKKHFLLSQITALSIKETLDEYTDHITVKWPNDIYFRDKKICGILIENEIMGNQFISSIIGIGLNVNQEVFTSDAPNPVSLKQIINTDIDLNELLEKILSKLMTNYQSILSDNTNDIIQQYKSSLYRKEGYFPFSDKQGSFSAKIEDVTEEGFLVLKTEEGEIRHYAFKEVVYKAH